MTAQSIASTKKKEPAFCGYFGTDFRTAYDLTGTGEGQTIGFTLWGETVPQSDYTKYATDTGTTALTVGGAGPNGLEFIQVGGSSTINGKDEVALDTEIAHAVAPGIHETYWLGANGHGTNAGNRPRRRGQLENSRHLEQLGLFVQRRSRRV